MPAEAVLTVSTSNAPNATNNTLIEQADPRRVANAQCGPSEPLVGPQASQSDNNHVSTRLRSKKSGLQNPIISSLDFASPSTVVDLTPSEPLTRKRQRHEAETTGPEVGQPEPQQGANRVYQQPEETIQCLKEEIQRLRWENWNQQARQLALIKGFVTSAAVIEVAVDVRGAELRSGLSSMGGTPEQMQEQARQMMHFSNATSRHVSMLVNDMLEEQGVYLNDSQQKTLRHEYGSAQPKQAMRAILDEKLPFTMERTGP